MRKPKIRYFHNTVSLCHIFIILTSEYILLGSGNLHELFTNIQFQILVWVLMRNIDVNSENDNINNDNIELYIPSRAFFKCCPQKMKKSHK